MKRYWQVFSLPEGGRWSHYISADTRADADADARYLINQGEQVRLVRSDRNPLEIVDDMRAGFPVPGMIKARRS